MNNKPVVYFSTAYNVELGSRANVYALNHPKFGQADVHTSTIIDIRGDGGFETRNTVYKPAAKELTASTARTIANQHIDKEKRDVFEHINKVAKNGHYYADFSRMSMPMRDCLAQLGYVISETMGKVKVEW